MSLTATEIQEKIDKLRVNMERLDLITNGDTTVEVTIDSGTVPSIAKFFEYIENTGEGFVGESRDIYEALAERYLGAKTSDSAASASVDNAPVEGALYFNSALGKFRVYHSGSWQDQSVAVDDGSITPAKLAPISPLGSTNTRPIIEVIRDIPPSIAWYGATPGADNFEAKFEAALAANKVVSVPNGEYEFTRTVQAPQFGNKIFGQSELATRLMRSGNWAGPTLRFGAADQSLQAGDCTVERVWMEQRHPGFTTGQQTMDQSTRQTLGQAHIQIFGGVHANMNEIRFQHGVYGISCYGTVHSKFTDIHSHGSWDNKNPLVSESVATIHLGEIQSIPQFKYNTEIRIERSYIGTGGPSPNRTITIGDVVYEAYENVGPQFGVLVQGCEGLEIVDGYIGGCGQSCIAFQPFGLITMVNIDGMFLDECYKANIEHLPFGGGVVTNVTLGAGIRCNSQFHTQHALYVPSTGVGDGTSMCGLSITGGQYLNMLRTPFFLEGVGGAVISPGLVGGYNPKFSTTTDVAVQAGAYVGGASRDIHFQGGLYGGGVNNYGTSNGAKWAVYTSDRPNVTAANIRAILGLSGGTVIGGSAGQTYPTT